MFTNGLARLVGCPESVTARSTLYCWWTRMGASIGESTRGLPAFMEKHTEDGAQSSQPLDRSPEWKMPRLPWMGMEVSAWLEAGGFFQGAWPSLHDL